MIAIGSGLTFGRPLFTKASLRKRKTLIPKSSVFRVINGDPGSNLLKLLELIGGVDNFVGKEDIVIIKPNVQWWNQGAPNLLTLYTFIKLIMERPGGFSGEVVVAENCHRGKYPLKYAGWSKFFDRNSAYDGVNNFYDLTQKLKAEFSDRYSTVHWVDVDAGAKRIYSPGDGEGYVYCDGTNGIPWIGLDNGCKGVQKRSVIMTYPIFKTDRGTLVDFKRGIWADGKYFDQPIRFINFAALNHHSEYCGATSAIKNYLGVTDLSGGPDPNNGGKITGDYYNFHSFPFNNWEAGPKRGMIGAEIGFFMNTVRKADLNITSAEWIGLASRTALPAARTRAIIASTDPVALDYHSTKYLLYPNSKISVHDPDNMHGPLYHDLKVCADVTGYTFDESNVKVVSWDHATNTLQFDDQLVVNAERHWGSDIRTLIKYGLFRWLPGAAGSI
jgi:hypothetical protein